MQSELEVQQFLKRLSITLDEQSRIRPIVEALRRGQPKYSLYTKPGGARGFAAKATIDKISHYLDQGQLDPYLRFLDSNRQASQQEVLPEEPQVLDGGPQSEAATEILERTYLRRVMAVNFLHDGLELVTVVACTPKEAPDHVHVEHLASHQVFLKRDVALNIVEGLTNQFQVSHIVVNVECPRDFRTALVSMGISSEVMWGGWVEPHQRSEIRRCLKAGTITVPRKLRSLSTEMLDSIFIAARAVSQPPP